MVPDVTPDPVVDPDVLRAEFFAFLWAHHHERVVASVEVAGQEWSLDGTVKLSGSGSWSIGSTRFGGDVSFFPVCWAVPEGSPNVGR